MILTALKELAEREGLISNPDYQPWPVRWLVTLGPEGVMYGGFQDTQQQVSRTTATATAQRFEVPKRSKRTSQDFPEFIVDKLEYVFGWPEGPDLADRAACRHRLYTEEVERAFAATGDEALGALCTLLHAHAVGRTSITPPPEMATGDFVGFLYSADPEGPRLISSRPVVAEYWHIRRRERDAAPSKKARSVQVASDSPDSRSGQCLITGNTCVPVRLHPKIKGIPPGSDTKGGVPLTSVEGTAFKSYNLDAFGCATVSPHAADAYEKALNRLLADGYPNPVDGTPLPNRHFRLSKDTVVVFWTKGDDYALDLFADSVARGDPAAVEALYRATWKGRPVNLNDLSAFYALTLSGGKGRGTVRAWLETTLGRVLQNVKQYFDDLEIASFRAEKGQPRPLIKLLQQTAVLRDVDNIAPNLATAVFAAVLSGQPFPRPVLEAAVRRQRAERTAHADRFALIKAYLLRVRRAKRSSLQLPEVQPMLDESCRDPAYRLGRLFAVLEKVQQEATNASTTIRDRFYGAASATPIIVFPQLLRKNAHHLPKSNRPRFYEKHLQEVCEPLLPPTPFPHAMTLEQQGLFAVGYFHERQALFDPSFNAKRTSRYFPKASSTTETTTSGE